MTDPEATKTPAAPNDLADGESREVKGSGAKPYVLTNTGGVFSCTCPAWLHQSIAIEWRTCKHLKALRGEALETARIGGAVGQVTPAVAKSLPAVSSSDSGAPPLLLAHRWERDVDPTGWWLSEKLDGVRAYWDGTKLLSRLGKTFWAPDWFLAALPPDMPLDGELFGGRKKFQRTVSVVRRQDKSDAWREIAYVIFDAPKLEAVFEDRLKAIASLAAEKSQEHLRAHPHVLCKGVAHLEEELSRIEALGGEGLMIRKPGSRYESGRSTTLLKVKTFHDAEAVVRAYSPGTGRHLGRVGALECDLPNGIHFSVGTGLSDAERNKPPPIGTVITFRYQELTPDGVPRFPSYVGVRDDIALPTPTKPSPILKPAPAPAPAPAPDLNPLNTPAATRIFTKDNITWEITLAAQTHTVRRRRGVAVKMTSTTFDTPAAAWRDADALIAAQRADGWIETVDD